MVMESVEKDEPVTLAENVKTLESNSLAESDEFKNLTETNSPTSGG